MGEGKGAGAQTRKLETRLLLFESTRVLNRSNEVVISALTQRRDALEKEMNRAPAPPRLVVSLSLKSEGLEVRGAKASPSLPPLPGTKPWLRGGKGSRQGEKRSKAFRIKKQKQKQANKTNPLCTQITDLVPHAPSPARVDLFGNSSCDDNFVSEINHWSLNVPNVCAIQLGKVRIFVKKKNSSPSPDK